MDTARLPARVLVADLPADEAGPRHELIDGGLVVTPMANRGHQVLVGRVIEELQGLVVPRESGLLVLGPVNLVVSDNTLVIPDVAVVHGGDLTDDLGWSPEEVRLVVEVLSASTRRRDLTLKRDLYEELRIPYWIVDPAARSVTAQVPAVAPAWAREPHLEIFQRP